jgi:hypothetical protein
MIYMWVLDLVECIVVYKVVFRARCILARPVEELFYRPSTRYILARPTGQISAQRAIRLQRDGSDV